MLQPQLYAFGVLDVDIDRQGQITGIQWRRVLDIETGDKEIPPLPVAEQAARPLAKLAAAPAAVNHAGE